MSEFHAFEASDSVRTVWVGGRAAGEKCWRRLLSSSPDLDPKRNLLDFAKPTISLDGGFVYVEASAWATSPAVHEVNIVTGAERFVIDGGIVGLVRTGPYRGMLLVQRHKYRPAPQFGSYDPVDVVRPDGEVLLTVPGSAEDEGEKSVPAWLKAHGWSGS